MSRARKLKNNEYWDSTSISHKEKTLDKVIDGLLPLSGGKIQGIFSVTNSEMELGSNIFGSIDAGFHVTGLPIEIGSDQSVWFKFNNYYNGSVDVFQRSVKASQLCLNSIRI